MGSVHSIRKKQSLLQLLRLRVAQEQEVFCRIQKILAGFIDDSRGAALFAQRFVNQSRQYVVTRKVIAEIVAEA